jgi:glutamyl-tRNA synthetase
MAKLNEVLSSIEDFSSQNIQAIVKEWIESQGIGVGKVMMPLRLSLVGSLQGPDVFEIMGLIGKEETMSSINNAIKSISV